MSKQFMSKRVKRYRKLFKAYILEDRKRFPALYKKHHNRCKQSILDLKIQST